jgi:hypothetical protein
MKTTYGRLGVGPSSEAASWHWHQRSSLLSRQSHILNENWDFRRTLATWPQ